MAIQRGDTTQVSFTYPFDFDASEAIFITFAQRHSITKHIAYSFELTKEMLTYVAQIGEQPATVQARLTQAQTLGFDESFNVEMQVRVKLKTGEVRASDIIETTVGELLKDGEI